MAGNVYKGVGVQFGTKDTTVTTNPGISFTGSLQTRDVSNEADMEQIRDGAGQTIGKVYFDTKQVGTFEYVLTDAAAGGDITVLVPNVGDVMKVVDAKFTQINNTYWLIDSINTKGSNQAALRVSLKVTNYSDMPNISF